MNYRLPPILLLVCLLPVLLKGQIVVGDSLLNALERPQSDSSRIVLLLELGNSRQQSNQIEASEALFSALNLARELQSPEFIQKSLMALGSLFYYSGFHSRALLYFNEYYERAVASGNTREQLMARANFQSIELVQSTGYNDELKNNMLELLRDFEQLWEQTADTSLVVNVIPGRWVNLAILELQAQQLDDARNALDKADQYIRLFPEKVPDMLQVQTGLTRGLLLQRENQFEKAGDIFRDIARQCDSMGMSQMYFSAMYYQGTTALASGDTTTAKQLLSRVLEAGQTDGVQSLISNAARALANIYEHQGDAAAALEAIRISEEAEQKAKKEETARSLAKKELEIRLIELEKSLRKESNLVIYRLSVLIILLLIGSIIFLFIFLRTRKHKRINQLEAYKAEVEARKAKLDKQLIEDKLVEFDKKLSKELLNNLSRQQVISAAVNKLLAHLKGERPDNKLIEEVIRELRRGQDKAALQEFMTVFETVHSDFYNILLQAFPNLTQNERRLCAFIHLKMHIREIAPITGQSTRAIALARTRLRKKLGLTHTDIELEDFLDNFWKQQES